MSWVNSESWSKGKWRKADCAVSEKNENNSKIYMAEYICMFTWVNVVVNGRATVVNRESLRSS